MIMYDINKLRKMPDLAKKIEAFQPQPDPLDQEMKQLQVELLKAQIAAENARAERDSAAAQLELAKVNTEGAKAADLKSTADQKNLDFVEQESGVKQQRDLQKQGEQARANTQMKLIDNESKSVDREYDLFKHKLALRAKAKQ
jgi:hypothetical protein